MICHLHSGGPRKLVVDGVLVQTRRPENLRTQWYPFQSKSKDSGTRNANVQGQEMDVPAQAGSKSILPLPFCYTGIPHFIELRRGCDF